MVKLHKKVSLDDRFNTQLKKVQDAIEKLRVIIEESRTDTALMLTASQKMQLRHSVEDLSKLHDKA